MYGVRRGRILGSGILEGTVEEARAEILKGIGIPHLKCNHHVIGCSVQAGRQIPQRLAALCDLPLQRLIPSRMSEHLQLYLLDYPDEVVEVQCLVRERGPGQGKATTTRGCRWTFIQILS